ncbi:helix-turn-helix transcriptional regulator [Thalassolituus sp.]|jgi:DNA-binding transcriptional ArsR family regulator|uniref:ArsR/SmtB family transcription factor n=1 Tax=Thalassolituus sp. TaxID=2030822 RepID=UPI00261F0F3F|nr:helix-turn-helix domain-containing protein [uncultured Thalassolituus sp.]TNC92323.1 MAG: transcriptional regulator [Thalassolituus sp.]
MTQITEEQMVAAFKALSNPHRLRIYREILAHQRHDVGPDDDAGCLLYDFINKFDIGAPTVSHHVKELVKADLIRAERNGKYLSCYLNEPLRAALSGFLSQNCD